MRKNLLYTLLLMSAFSYACTDIQIKANDGGIIIGRTMDFTKDSKAELIVVPKSSPGSAFSPDNKTTFNWTNKYSYLAVTTFGDKRLISQAVNDQGLTFEALWLPETNYPKLNTTQYKNSVEGLSLINLLLGNYNNVNQVEEKLKRVNVWAKKLPEFGNRYPPIHFVFHDKLGNSIVVEYIDGKQHLYKNIGVVTNSPTYDWQLTNLRNYIGLGVYNHESIVINGNTVRKTGHGNGMFGLPGDYSPPSRFVRAVTLLRTSENAKTAQGGVILASHIINNVDLPFGVAADKKEGGTSEYDYTQWSTITDLKNNKLYIKTYDSLGYVAFDLTKIFSMKDPQLVKFTALSSLNNVDGTNLFANK